MSRLVKTYIRSYCNVATTLFLWLVTVTSPYRYTALLHIGNFDTWKRTNLKRAVSECRLYYNKELQSDNEMHLHLILFLKASIITV